MALKAMLITDRAFSRFALLLGLFPVFACSEQALPEAARKPGITIVAADLVFTNVYVSLTRRAFTLHNAAAGAAYLNTMKHLPGSLFDRLLNRGSTCMSMHSQIVALTENGRPGEAGDTPVDMTVFDGRIVYRRQDHSL